MCARLRPAAGARCARVAPAPAVPLSYAVLMTHANAARPDTARDDGSARRPQRAAPPGSVSPTPLPFTLPYPLRLACRRLPGPRPRLRARGGGGPRGQRGWRTLIPFLARRLRQQGGASKDAGQRAAANSTHYFPYCGRWRRRRCFGCGECVWGVGGGGGGDLGGRGDPDLTGTPNGNCQCS